MGHMLTQNVKNQDVLLWNATFASCGKDVVKHFRFSYQNAGLRSADVMNQLVRSVRRVRAREDASCANDAQEERGVVYLPRVISQHVDRLYKQECGRLPDTNIVERMDADTVALRETKRPKSSHQLADDAPGLVRRDCTRLIGSVVIYLQPSALLVMDANVS